jgi:Uncharacterised nucleotidyltransferase
MVCSRFLSSPIPDVSPEAAVLLWGAQTFFGTAYAQQPPMVLQHPFDWSHLLHIAHVHGVLPLMYRSLHTVDTDAVPQVVRATLRHQFHANAQHNLFLAGTLLKLLRHLEAHNILAVPYKGPVLAMTAYGNLALRQFGDLDILVSSQDAERAIALLLAQGYHWCDSRPRTLVPRFRKVAELTCADGRVCVELHWAITSSTFYFPLDLTHVWARLHPVSLLDTPVHTLPPEEMLLVLCIHGAKHHWNRLGWICDVAALLHRHEGFDWGQVMERASRLGGRRMLRLGLFLSQNLLGIALPEVLRRQLQADPTLPWLAQQVQSRLFSDAGGLLWAVDRPLFYLRLRERFRDQARCGLYLMYRMLISRRLPSPKGQRNTVRSEGS